MSLKNCPECGHEVSALATTCPNCAHPFPPATVPSEPVHRVAPAVVREEGGFPPWAVIPIVIGAAILIFVLYAAMRDDDTANTNINVNVAGRRQPVDIEPERQTQTVTVPSTGDTAVTTAPGQTTTVPGSSTGDVTAPPPSKGSVKIKAQVMAPRANQPSSVKGTKFYLLDRDLESILSEAGVRPVEGNTLAGSIGLAAVFPDRYRDFQRAAEAAIGKHVKYSVTTDSNGMADLSSVEPKSYYLFGITKVGRGFALWNSPVNIIAGDNDLNLSPQSVTEVQGSEG